LVDADLETVKHVREVQTGLHKVVVDLLARSLVHDDSKMEEPERSTFLEETPKLRNLTYGSAEYTSALGQMREALAHHYARHRHHPEHYPDGLSGMNLIDLIEMLIDWSAASKRHANGSLKRSIEQNQQRFGYSDEMKGLLTRTAEYLGILDAP
jgi:hypothetical protein